MVLLTTHLKKLTGTLRFNTTQLSVFCFCVTRTTGNPVYAHGASNSYSLYDRKFLLLGNGLLSIRINHMHALRTCFFIPPTSHLVYSETMRPLRSLAPVEVREHRHFAIRKPSDEGFS